MKPVLLLFVCTWMVVDGLAQKVVDRPLQADWYIQSSAVLGNDGAQLSDPNFVFHASQWYPTSVPHTVLATLVKDGVYKDIFQGRRLSQIPDSLFQVPWWYRTEFELPELSTDQQITLCFEGINYRADVWLNGHQIASADTLKGSFRRFRFPVTTIVHPGKNVLAVRVFPPGAGDLAIGFVDWNPEPPDHDMGIWRPVRLRITGPVSVSAPFVSTVVDTATLDQAWLTVRLMLHNHTGQTQHATVQVQISPPQASAGQRILLRQDIKLAPYARREVVFTPDAYPALHIRHPQLWWTHDWGKPALYRLHAEVWNGKASRADSLSMRFGIRSISAYRTPQGYWGYRLNGKPILIKGGGWTDPMLLDASPAYEEAEIDYAVHMGLNAIRMEGFWGHDQHIYDLCDEKGILIMAGFSCQWEWKNLMHSPDDQYSAIITPEQNDIAAASWRDQVLWLRHHPSIFLWLYGSDKWPRPALEQRYLGVLHQFDTTRPFTCSAAEHTSVLTGFSGMKMRGPYDYVPPDYWYIDTLHGGAYGFNTETSPGPEIPVLSSLQKMIPADSLWPIGTAWLYHSARGQFYNLTYFNRAMEQRLGPPADLQDYLRKAQFLDYEGERAMFEAFEANRFKATGIIQWMYNASWPKLWWQLFDYYLMPTGAFYGVKKACEPLHIAYDYGRKDVDLINNNLQPALHLHAEAKLVDVNGKILYQRSTDIPALEAQQTIHLNLIQQFKNLPLTYFLVLTLWNDHHKEISRNVYVLSSQDDLLDEAKSTWYVTPQSQFANLQRLQNLPAVKLEVHKHFVTRGDTTFATVELFNPSSHIAFMVDVDVCRSCQSCSASDVVTPVYWDDNDITLLPGERRIIKARVFTKDLQGKAPDIHVTGWNVVTE
ncbi:MAG: beta galactosidase jelly roll domain-containing protein [Thermoflavifilum sp.]|uniref:glycoside hydrolase family 2 protein n=1 Tax=Thermoflavifilum sp. TaxID=1968839 RepID=UPI0018A3A2D4|nr:sugar-binding domain-containing protein [Thermoflavifilum sp.]QOR75693.1 MAG: beta galactosidase jelly roll domain-containing protein [Thermoflavifilum sp.]